MPPLSARRPLCSAAAVACLALLASLPPLARGQCPTDASSEREELVCADPAMKAWGDPNSDSCEPAYATPQCTLLGGWMQNLLQPLLLAVGFGSLYVKKLMEDARTEKTGGEKRDFRTWGLDASKQGFSAIAAHICGLFNASVLNAHTCFTDGHKVGKDDARATDECGWYFMSFTMDTTLGVLFAYMLHSCLANLTAGVTLKMPFCWNRLAIKTPEIRCLGKSGEYTVNGVLDYGIWARQMGAWCVVTVLARFMVLGASASLIPALTPTNCRLATLPTHPTPSLH